MVDSEESATLAKSLMFSSDARLLGTMAREFFLTGAPGAVVNDLGVGSGEWKEELMYT